MESHTLSFSHLLPLSTSIPLPSLSLSLSIYLSLCLSLFHSFENLPWSHTSPKPPFFLLWLSLFHYPMTSVNSYRSSFFSFNISHLSLSFSSTSPPYFLSLVSILYFPLSHSCHSPPFSLRILSFSPWTTCRFFSSCHPFLFSFYRPHLKDLMNLALDSLSICSVSSRCWRKWRNEARMMSMYLSCSTCSWLLRATSLENKNTQYVLNSWNKWTALRGIYGQTFFRSFFKIFL